MGRSQVRGNAAPPAARHARVLRGVAMDEPRTGRYDRKEDP